MYIVYAFFVHYLHLIFQDPGVLFNFDGERVFFRGTVTVLSADNLAAWCVGGYKALASAFRKCQYCMVTDDNMQTEVCNYICTKLKLLNYDASFFPV